MEFDQEARILLISASPVVKEACQITRLTKTLEDFIIVEKSLKSFKDVHQSVRVVHGEVSQLLPDQHVRIPRNELKKVLLDLCLQFCNCVHFSLAGYHQIGGKVFVQEDMHLHWSVTQSPFSWMGAHCWNQGY